MSNYENYVVDFPNRCKNVLELAELAAKEWYDVTLLLMVAATALTVPYERLKPAGNLIQPIKDRTRYEQAADHLNKLLDKWFLTSPLWNDSAKSWRSGDLDLPTIERPPDEWEQLRTRPSFRRMRDNSEGAVPSHTRKRSPGGPARLLRKNLRLRRCGLCSAVSPSYARDHASRRC